MDKSLLHETLDERWTFTTRSGRELKLWNVERQPYAKGKVDAEILCYEWGEEHGIDVVTSNPCHVLGPLLGASQNTGWQGLIGRMPEGNGAHDDRRQIREAAPRRAAHARGGRIAAAHLPKHDVREARQPVRVPAAPALRARRGARERQNR